MVLLLQDWENTEIIDTKANTKTEFLEEDKNDHKNITSANASDGCIIT